MASGLHIGGSSSQAASSKQNGYPSGGTSPTTRPPKQNSIKSIHNDTQSVQPLVKLLLSSLATLSATQLVAQIRMLCEKLPEATTILQESVLVKGEKVVRYHADTDSEDECCSDADNDEGASYGQIISIANEGFTSRYAKCENCDDEFDVTNNPREGCYWHPGTKDVDLESSVWDDHDENCHGAFMDFEDDEDYAQAFIWQCCGRPGNDPGCKITRHKSKTNTIIAPDAQPTKKRKATDTLRKPKDPQCANCGKRYDPKNNSGEGGHCFFHSGTRTLVDGVAGWSCCDSHYKQGCTEEAEHETRCKRVKLT